MIMSHITPNLKGVLTCRQARRTTCTPCGMVVSSVLPTIHLLLQLPPTPPSLKGYLMHADGGYNLIGVVYSKNDGNVYYNSTEDGDLYDGITWSGETLLGTGTEARITIDRNDNSHVVFTTTDGRIAYCKHDGTAWSDPVYIESKFGGSCSKPDIDVDINGYAHITYTDYDSACNDILYAENTTNNSL